MKRCVLICNGSLKDLRFHRDQMKNDDFIIAVDGGANHCHRMGITPNLMLGDFDSIDKSTMESFAEVPRITVPAEKDFTDIILGIEEAKKRNYKDILILGALGGKRIDMEISNLLLLSRYREFIEIADDVSSVRCVRAGESIEVSHRQDQYLSIIPLSPLVKTGKSYGLKYPLEGLEFSFGTTCGISNEIISETAELTILEGEILLICQKK
ncbi:MAG TPA: thiamine diphosphokinase [Firmicutes bacterium]|nr:thiamine diphosphokinase [Bacillota bacterium]